MTRDEQIAAIKHSGATLHVLAFKNTHIAVSNDIESLRWLLDISVIESIERDGKYGRYKGKVVDQ